jgi:hypothetical protein
VCPAFKEKYQPECHAPAGSLCRYKEGDVHGQAGNDMEDPTREGVPREKRNILRVRIKPDRLLGKSIVHVTVPDNMLIPHTIPLEEPCITIDERVGRV